MQNALAVAQQRLSTQYALALILADASALEDAAPRILQTVCEGLDWQVGILWQADQREGVLRFVMSWHSPAVAAKVGVREFLQSSEEMSFPKGRGLPGQVWAKEEPRWIPDVTQDKEFARSTTAAAANLHGAFGFPICLGGESVGVLEFFSHEVREPDQQLLESLTVIGSEIGQFMRRVETTELLRQNERRKSAIMEAALDSIIIMDHEGRVVEFNPAAAQTFGYSQDQAVGQLLADLIIPPALREQHQRGLSHYLATGEGPLLNQRIEVGAMRADGSEFPVELTIIPIRLGEQPLFTGYLRDISAHKHAEARLAFMAEASQVFASSLNYQETLDNLARLAVPRIADWCVVDVIEDGSLKRVAVAHQDPAMQELARELLLRYPPEPDEPHGVAYVLRTGQAQLMPDITDELLVEVARDDAMLGMLRSLGLSSAMVVPLAASGKVLGALTLVAAESARRYTPEDLAQAEELAYRAALMVENARLYREAQRALHAAEAASRAKDEFLAVLSHELRTPLTPVLGWLSLLRSNKISADTSATAVADALEIIERNVRTQAQLIEDLLDVSRIISGKLRLEVRPMELAPVIEAAVETIRPSAEAKSIHLQVLLNSHIGMISGDPDRLQQVLWNLLTNAVKFTPKKGRIRVQLERVDSQVLITVQDNGEGINQEFLPYLFERFRQADNSSTRKYGGLGLGMAIVKQLVEMHGGKISVESAGEGFGTTFRIHFPILPVQVQPDSMSHRVTHKEAASVAEEMALLDSLEAHTPQHLLAGLRILVVEDEADARALIQTVLSQYGAQVLVATSAQEGLKTLDYLVPDVIVSDVGMPEEDGYTFLRKVRARSPEQGGKIPAIALTAYARPEDRLRAMTVGFQNHLAKPIQPVELAVTVASVIGRNMS